MEVFSDSTRDLFSLLWDFEAEALKELSLDLAEASLSRLRLRPLLAGVAFHSVDDDGLAERSVWLEKAESLLCRFGDGAMLKPTKVL